MEQFEDDVSFLLKMSMYLLCTIDGILSNRLMSTKSS